MNKKCWKKFLVALILVGGLNFSPTLVNFDIANLQIFSVAHAEIKTVFGDDVAMFDFGEDDAKIVNTVKNVAKMRAIQAAREKAGVYVKSYTTTSNGVLTKDDISAITNNISEILDVKYERSIFQPVDANGNSYGNVGIMYTAIVTVKINTDGIYDYLKKSSEEKANIIQQDKNLQNSVLETVGNFEDVRANAKNQNVEQVHEDLNKIDNEISASEKIDEGNKLAYQEDYSAAISKYNEAIKLNPDDPSARENIEIVYSDKKSVEQAIRNFDKEIQRNPQNADAYNNRGIAYYNLGKIYENLGYGRRFPRRNGFNPASLLNPIGLAASIVSSFNKKPTSLNIKNYKLAIKDFSQTIKLNSKNADAYYNRGIVYQALGKKEKANVDFAKYEKLRSKN